MMRADAHGLLTQMAALVVAFAGWAGVMVVGGGMAALVAPAVALGLFAITIEAINE